MYDIGNMINPKIDDNNDDINIDNIDIEPVILIVKGIVPKYINKYDLILLFIILSSTIKSLKNIKINDTKKLN